MKYFYLFIVVFLSLAPTYTCAQATTVRDYLVGEFVAKWTCPNCNKHVFGPRCKDCRIRFSDYGNK